MAGSDFPLSAAPPPRPRLGTQHSHSGPVIMLGLDGASWPLIEQWAGGGHLPVLAELIAGGTRGRLRTPEGFNDNAVWASFSTSLRPLRHGWLHYNRVRPGTYDAERVTRDSIDGVPFWQVLSDQGRTVTVLDVPKSPRGHGLNGVELVDWLTHGVDSLVPLSEPPELVVEVVAAHGPAHPRECLEYGRTGEALVDWIDARYEMARRKGDLLVEQLAARDADLVLGVFNPSHCIGHQCWHLHDESHPDHDPAMVARVGDPLLALYATVDEQIGRIIDAAPADATVIVFACLGMGTNFGATGVLETVLLRLDRATPRTVLTPQGATSRAWRRLVPLGLRKRMPVAWHQLAKRRARSLRSRRTFFHVDTGARTSGIRINLAGREPEGLVRPGEDYETVIADLVTALHELRDADTGAPLVREVERTTSNHQGPYAAALPDLFVHWKAAPGPVRAVRSDRVGQVMANPPDRTGHHHAHGFFVARGPGLAAGVVARDAEVVDLAPTAAAMLGVELSDVDGKAIPELSISPA